MSDQTVLIKPGVEPFGLTVDGIPLFSSLASAHEKGDGALAGVRELKAGQQDLSAAVGYRVTVEAYEKDKAAATRERERLAAENASLRDEVTKLRAEFANRLEELDQKLSERIRLAANLAELVPAK